MQIRAAQAVRYLGAKRGANIIRCSRCIAALSLTRPRPQHVHRDALRSTLSAARVRTEDVVLIILIEVIPGYTEGMKTAISLPDDTYEQATRQAQVLGISRSEFFARAARSYLDQLASRSLTQQIDEALRTGDDDSNAAAAAAGRSYLAGQDDW